MHAFKPGETVRIIPRKGRHGSGELVEVVRAAHPAVGPNWYVVKHPRDGSMPRYYADMLERVV